MFKVTSKHMLLYVKEKTIRELDPLKKQKLEIYFDEKLQCKLDIYFNCLEFESFIDSVLYNFKNNNLEHYEAYLNGVLIDADISKGK